MPRIRAAITVRYRESDLCFIARLLALEGLVFRFALNEEAPCGHTLLILADTAQPDSCPNDANSAQSGGIRFHRKRQWARHRNGGLLQAGLLSWAHLRLQASGGCG